MSMRFHRRVRLGAGTTLNIGKTGLSLSLGTRGAHMTFGSNGTRATIGIPGTGLFWSENITASEKRRIRAENKRRRDEAYAAERQRRIWDRQQKRQEREIEKERKVREKQINLDNIKSEYDQFQGYITNISHLHNINMLSAKSAQDEFFKRSQPLEFKSPYFFIDDYAKDMHLYSQNISSLENCLSENRENFLIIRNRLIAARKKLARLKEINNILTLRKNCLNKLSSYLGLLIIGIILLFFISPLGAGLIIISIIMGVVELLKNMRIIINYKATRDLKYFCINPKEIHNVINKNIPDEINSDSEKLKNEINFYNDCQHQLNLIVQFCSKLEHNKKDIKYILDSDSTLRKYNSYSYEELKDAYLSWMYPDEYKSQWQAREDKRQEFLKNVTNGNIEAISELCDVLLPLSIDIKYPLSFAGVKLNSYEVGYHIETAKEGWILIELPDVDIIPAYWAQLSPGGKSLTYPAVGDRKRFNLYEKFAASFSLLHVLLFYLTYPFFEKIWIEAYTMVIDSSTGMPRKKDIVEGWIATNDFSKFNFNKVDAIEALKALNVKIYPFSSKQFVEPTWADKDNSLIWASRDKDIPDGLLPF